MNMMEKVEACQRFYNSLCNALKETHKLIPSCNMDLSTYLVPKGTEDQITYYSKPVMSFRFSDHWTWYASVRKCSNKSYIQCFLIDGPVVKKRLAPERASRPIRQIAVAIYGPDNRYHTVYGEVFDRRFHSWYWKESSVEDVVSKYFG